MRKGLTLLYVANGLGAKAQTLRSKSPTIRERFHGKSFLSLKLSEKMQRIFFCLALGHKRTLGWEL